MITVEFHTTELEEMAYSTDYTGRWDAKVVKAYRKKVHLIKQAHNQQDLYAFRSLHLEKLKGKRRHQHSLRLNDQYRLIIEFGSRSGKETAKLIEIEDYH